MNTIFFIIFEHLVFPKSCKYVFKTSAPVGLIFSIIIFNLRMGPSRYHIYGFSSSRSLSQNFFRIFRQLCEKLNVSKLPFFLFLSFSRALSKDNKGNFFVDFNSLKLFITSIPRKFHNFSRIS